MQKKRSAKEAFNETSKPRLSAFAAARAKAASKVVSSPAVENVPTENIQTNPQNGTVKDPGALPALLSSFPLSKTQEELAEASSNDEEEAVAQFSDDDENYLRAYSNSSLKASQPTKLSTLGPDKYSVISDHPDRLVLKLEPDQTATLIGEYDLKVVSGIVMVYGAVLRAGSKAHRVYAPSTHALPAITAKGGTTEIAIISTGRSLDGLSRLSPLWSRLWYSQRTKDEDEDEIPIRSFALLRSSSDDPLKRAVSALEIEQETQITLNKILSKPTTAHPSSVVMVCGPKAAGKSTISRWLANTFLTASKASASSSCFWLDLDPGQPEFSAPGQISLVQIREPLLGPNYTHPSTHVSSACRTIRSHTLATVSPKEDVDHFLSCAFELRDAYSQMLEDFAGAPLIINCSGWVLGSAVSVMTDLAQHFPVTDVVLMQPMELETIALIEAAAPVAKVLTISSRSKPAYSRTSAELRAMQTMSYFHSTAPEKGLRTWTDKALSEMQPWHVRFNGSDSGISSIMSYGEGVNPDFLATVIDGMVLALCVIENDEAYRAMQEPDRISRTPEGIPYLQADSNGLIKPLDPRFSSCKGLVLVRGIDVDRQELQLLTPLSGTEITQLDGARTVLVRGKFDSPDWAFLEDIYSGAAQKMTEQEVLGDAKDKTSRPYVAERDADAGLGGNVWRVRHLPRKMGGDAGA